MGTIYGRLLDYVHGGLADNYCCILFENLSRRLLFCQVTSLCCCCFAGASTIAVSNICSRFGSNETDTGLKKAGFFTCEGDFSKRHFQRGGGQDLMVADLTGAFWGMQNSLAEP